MSGPPVPQGPALPWGVQQEQPSEQEDKGVSLESVGLAPSARIEVKWNVEPEEGDSYTRVRNFSAHATLQSVESLEKGVGDSIKGGQYLFSAD